MTDKEKLNGASQGNVRDISEERAKRQNKPEKPEHEPILNIPRMVKILCSIFIAMFLLTYFLDVETANQIFLYLAFLPNLYVDPSQGYVWQLLTMPFTHALLHGGWFHLFINLGMMLAFGSAVEKYIGGKKLLVFFLITTAIGGLTHLAFYWGSVGALIGASGGISGLFGVLLRILQDRGQMEPGWRGLMPITLLWVGVSVLFALFTTAPGGGSIAWTAHVGGFLSGLLLYTPVMRMVK